jgi:hypothetical protein
MIRVEDYQNMIDDCINRSEKMTDWEVNFIDSIDHRMGKGHGITDPQAEILARIWEKVT